MRLSEVPINPVWSQEKKTYVNGYLDFALIDQIVFSNIQDNKFSSKYGICFGTSRKIEMIA